MTPSLRIYLLGAFEIFREEKLISNAAWRSQQTRTICKILLARRGEVVTCDQLIEILWPDDDPADARRRLHVRISQLRRALGTGKSCLLSVDGGYLFQVAEECRLDVDEFQKWISVGNRLQEASQLPEAILAYEQALQLYRGDFLAEDLYADWAFAGREHYREVYLTLLITLAESYARQGRYRLALTRTRQALARDPLRESIYVRLMVYHYYAGERSQALHAFERCRQLLAAELAVEPLETTQKIAEQIRMGTLWASSDAPHYPPPIYAGHLFEVPYALSEVPCVGREREYAWLVGHWQDPSRRVILLEGEAGIGKTRLAEVFTGYAAAQGTRLLHIRLPSTQRAPLAALATALQPVLSRSALAPLEPATRALLATIFPTAQVDDKSLPPQPGLSPEAERERLFQAVADFAATNAEPATLLWVDDAHRLGAIALQLLARLADSWQLLLSYRSEETPPEHPLRQIFGNHALQLDVLSPAGVQTLLSQLAGQEMPALAAQIFTQSGGQPLFIIALLQHLFETGQLYVDANGHWGQTGEFSQSLPPSMRAAIESRLLHLPRAPRGIFDLIAVLGGEFDFDLLLAASQQSEESLLAAVDELIAAAMLREPRQQGLAEFVVTHEHYLEVAYATLPGVRRRKLHRQVARAIEVHYAERLNAFYPALARHYDLARNPKRAVHFARLAGEQAAAQYDNDAALAWLSRALELIPSGEYKKRTHLLLVREKIYDLQGMRSSQATDLAEMEALAHQLPPRQQAQIALQRAGYEWIMGCDERAEISLMESLHQAQAAAAQELEARVYLLKGRMAKDLSIAEQDLAQARLLAQKTNQRALEGEIVRATGNMCFWRGRYADSKTNFETALNIHQQVGDVRGELSALNNLGQVLQLLGQPSKAIQYYEQSLAVSRKIGDQLAQGVLLTNLGGLQLLLGDFEQAQVTLEQGLEIRRRIGNDEGAAVALKLSGDAARQQGQYEQAAGYYQQALEINTRIQHPKQSGETYIGLAALHRDLGNYTRAKEFLARAQDVLPPEETASRLQALSLGCSLHLLCSDPGLARSMGEQVVSQSEAYPAISGEALTNLGQVLLSQKQMATAEKHFTRALELRQNLGQFHLTAEPRAGLAQIALAQGELSTAKARADEIWQMAETSAFPGTERPMWVVLTCYQAYQQAGDARAIEVLTAAHGCLQKRAAQIKSAELRAAFLGEVPEHQEIARLWGEIQ